MEQKFSNKLTPAELERLALLAEECSEVIQIINKIIRHGYESYNPFDKNKTENRLLLAREIAHVYYAIDLVEGCDVSSVAIQTEMAEKAEKIQKYLHHNKI